MRRALVAGALLAFSLSAWAYPPQPTEEIAASATSRLTRLLAAESLSDDELIDNLRRYYGQDFEARSERHNTLVTQFYLIRRDEKTADITFLWLLGERARQPSE